VNELIKYLSGNKDIEDSIDSIIEELNEIVNARTIEKYKVEHFLGNEPLTALANKILNNWLSIRLALLNYKFQGNNIKEKFDKSIIRLRENQILEQRLNFSVFILLSKNYDLADYD
jgi:tRNA threonylcarbamoyladenosine modification (KEOPS) complex Cgi121 subunit